MTLLWISLIVGVAFMVAVALRAVDRERRLFFATGRRDEGGGRKGASTHTDRLRHMLVAIRGKLARITLRRGARMSHAADGRSSNVSLDLPRRRPRREHAAQTVLRAMREAGSAPLPAVGPVAPAADKGPPADNTAGLAPAIDTEAPVAAPTGEGMVRIDPNGQLHSPDEIARQLLHWTSGTRTLSEILAGGSQQAAALLESVARREVVEHTATVLAGGLSQQLHFTALASRSADGSLSGALLIIRRL